MCVCLFFPHPNDCEVARLYELRISEPATPTHALKQINPATLARQGLPPSTPAEQEEKNGPNVAFPH